MDLTLSRSRAPAIAALFALLASHSGAAADPQSVEAERRRLRAAGFEQMLREEQTLLRVSDSIRRAGKALCGEKLSPVWGLVVAAPKDLPSAYREPAAKAVGGRQGASVLVVEPGSPAARAGIVPADVVLAVADRRVRRAVDLGWREDAQLASPATFRVGRGAEVRDLPSTSRSAAPFFLSLPTTRTSTPTRAATGEKWSFSPDFCDS